MTGVMPSAWHSEGFRLQIIPALGDHRNYIYLLIHDASGEAVAIDPGAAAPVVEALEAGGLHLRAIWLTHHHWDHVDGANDLRARYDCAVIGHAKDAPRLPPLTREVNEGETVTFHHAAFSVLEVPGHTIGHIAYYSAALTLLFSGDTLFSLGCGRLFEGSPEQMFASLQRLSRLPGETLICGGHEYTQSNARFALHVDSANQALHQRSAEIDRLVAEGMPTYPSSLRIECQTNPFLRAPNADDFAILRQAKDVFKG